jgi:hypothetical protein
MILKRCRRPSTIVISGIVLSALLVLLWGFSFGRQIRYAGKYWVIDFASNGDVGIYKYWRSSGEGQSNTIKKGFYVYRMSTHPCFPSAWKLGLPRTGSSGTSKYVTIPLWIPLLVIVGATIITARHGSVIRYLVILSLLVAMIGFVGAWVSCVLVQDAFLLLPLTRSLFVAIVTDATPSVWKSTTSTYINIPYWFVGVLLATYPAWTLVGRPVYNYRRYRRGHCIKCGYNLTGNASGVCPECGTKRDEIPKAEAE